MDMTRYQDHILLRLIHSDMLEEVLTNGMYSKNSGHVISGYINIGDTELIKQRDEYVVKIDPPNGHLGDYIPFYFAGHSPMLLNIKTGYRGIKKYPQSDLVFLVCKISDVIEQCPHWCFTDGHAKSSITKFYNDIEDLSLLDWDTINLQFWNSTEDDYDRMRRKQAEFLVKKHVPLTCISQIIVINAEQSAKIKEIESRIGIDIPVVIDKQRKYFYP